MAPEASVLQIVYAISVVSSIIVAAFLWGQWEKRGSVPLFWYVLSGLFWGGIQLASILIDDYAISVALHRVLYIVIALGVLSLFVFALTYTGREQYLGPKTYLALSIHPIFVTVFALVDPGGLFLGPIESAPSTAIGVAPEYGPAILIHLVYAYVLVIVVTALFADMLYRSRSLYRGQSIALIAGAVLPASAPLALIFDLLEFDPTPIVIPIASAFFAVAIVRYRLIDLVPIARDRVVEHVNDGVFVIDSSGQLTDINPEGRRIVATVGAAESPLGKSFVGLFDSDEFHATYEHLTETAAETSGEVSLGSSQFQLTVTPIEDDRDRHVGWLVIAHDVTERNRRETQLERQNERLEQFANLVSHDLRNPLTVADGYLELARETDDNDQYLEKVDNAHDRMETIIDDVLALAREGKDVTDPQAVTLERVAERAWTNVETGDATLEVRSSEPISADPDRVQRLLENLFRNSMEHGSTNSQPEADDSLKHGSTSSQRAARADDSVEHGSMSSRPGADNSIKHGSTTASPLTITVGPIDANGSTAGFFVADDGVGISDEQRERIFEDGYSTNEDGTGFGLSIVSQIADAHGWAVDVTDSDSGGVRFEFSGVEVADSVAPTESVSE